MFGGLYVRLLGLFAFREKRKKEKRHGVIYLHNLKKFTIAITIAFFFPL